MKLGHYVVGFLHPYIQRQKEVQCFRESGDWVRAIRQAVDNLALGVSSRISTTGAPDPDIFSGESLERSLYYALDGGLIGLKLEPRISGSIIFYYQRHAPT